MSDSKKWDTQTEVSHRTVSLETGEDIDPEDLPDDVRAEFQALLADNNGDGVPDAFEKILSGETGIIPQSSSSSSVTMVNGIIQNITVDGKTYASLDDVPAEHRNSARRAMSLIDSGINTSTEPEGIVIDTNEYQSVTNNTENLSKSASKPDYQYESSIQRHSGSSKLAWMIVAILLAVIVYFL